MILFITLKLFERQEIKSNTKLSSTLSAHLKAAGRRSFKMQAPGWTFAILPLALSMLASDAGSSAGAQPSIEEEERGSRISTLPLDTSNKDAVWMISGERKWKVNLPFMVVFTWVTRTQLCVSANHYQKPFWTIVTFVCFIRIISTFLYLYICRVSHVEWGVFWHLGDQRDFIRWPSVPLLRTLCVSFHVSFKGKLCWWKRPLNESTSHIRMECTQGLWWHCAPKTPKMLTNAVNDLCAF